MYARFLQHECALGKHPGNSNNSNLPILVGHFWNLRNDEIAKDLGPKPRQTFSLNIIMCVESMQRTHWGWISSIVPMT